MSYRQRPFIIRKSSLSEYTLFLVLILPCFVPAEILSVLLLLLSFLWLGFFRRGIKRLFFLVSPLLLLIAIGFIGAYKHPAYDVLRDVWYVGKAIPAIALGYLLIENIETFGSICRVIINAAVAASLIHLGELFFHFGSGMSFFEMRNKEEIRGFIMTVIGLAILVTFRREKMNLAKDLIFYYVATFLCAFSLIASLSRTLIISFITMIIVLRGWHKLSTKNMARALSLGVVALAALSIGLAYSGANNQKSIATKFANSYDELEIQDYESQQDISLHWRGFETYRALQEYMSGDILEKIFGKGLGATIDLGLFKNLGGIKMRYIPVLHNGYMYVLVKFGVVGIIIYFYFLLKIILIKHRSRYSGIQDTSDTERFISGLGWVFLFTTLVIAGVFNKSTLTSALILVGGLVSFMDKDRYLSSRRGY
jgi:hypothetical protein